MIVADGYDIAWQVAQALEKLGVEYFLGGSMASSLQGPPRFTNDIDFVVHLRADQVAPLTAALGADFDVDDVALVEAIRARRSWNIFHTPTATRIDLFPVGPQEFDVEELFRRQRRDLGGGRALFDAVGVLQFQGDRLDQRYLDAWAKKLGLDTLLARARAAALGT